MSSRTKVYRVRFGDAAEAEQPVVACLRGAVTVGFSLLVYGGGSVDDLAACAQSRSVTAHLRAARGRVRALHPRSAGVRERGVRGALPRRPPCPRAADREERGSALAGACEWRRAGVRAADCLRGAIATGFSLVLYEGGSVEDSRHVRAGQQRQRRLRPARRRVGVLHPRSAGLREPRRSASCSPPASRPPRRWSRRARGRLRGSDAANSRPPDLPSPARPRSPGVRRPVWARSGLYWRRDRLRSRRSPVGLGIGWRRRADSTPSAIARCVLPVPIGPAMTTSSARSMYSQAASCESCGPSTPCSASQSNLLAAC